MREFPHVPFFLLLCQVACRTGKIWDREAGLTKQQSSLEKKKKKVIATKIPITKQSRRNSAVHFQRATPYFTFSSAFFSTWGFWKSSFNSFLQTSTGCQAFILIWTESIILYFPLSTISQPTPVEWKILLMRRETLRSQAGKKKNLLHSQIKSESSNFSQDEVYR